LGIVLFLLGGKSDNDIIADTWGALAGIGSSIRNGRLEMAFFYWQDCL
jgi:hypothetical protein